MSPHIENITSFEFDQGEVIIDVGSPSEFNEDHVSGAINLPVLSDEEFQITIYKEVSPFEASKIGRLGCEEHFKTLGRVFVTSLIL